MAKEKLRTAACGSLLWFCLWMSASLYGADVVVHADVPLQSLTQAQLRNIFTLRQVQWPDGSAITVVVLPLQHQLHQQFSKEYLRLFPYQLVNIWDRQSFSGIAGRPLLVEDVEQMRELLRRTPGSIGYVAHYTEEDALKELRIER